MGLLLPDFAVAPVAVIVSLATLRGLKRMRTLSLVPQRGLSPPRLAYYADCMCNSVLWFDLHISPLNYDTFHVACCMLPALSQCVA